MTERLYRPKITLIPEYLISQGNILQTPYLKNNHQIRNCVFENMDLIIEILKLVVTNTGFSMAGNKSIFSELNQSYPNIYQTIYSITNESQYTTALEKFEHIIASIYFHLKSLHISR